MTPPNATFMRHYGTESDFLQKEAGLSPFARRMLMVMIASKMQRGMSHGFDAEQQQAAAFNQEFQRLQLQKLGPSIESIHHTNPPVFAESGGDIGAMPYQVPIGMDTGMVRVASALGAELAQMDKKGGIMSSLAGAFAGGPKPLAKGLFQVGNALKAPVRGIGAAVASGPGQKAIGALSGAAQRVGQGAAAVAANPGVQKAVGGAKALGRGALTAGAVGLGAAGLGAYALAKPALGYLSKEQPPANWGHADYGAPQLAYGVNPYGQPNYGAPFIR